MHELGHALGLGHDEDQESAMFGELRPGTGRRTLSAAGIHLPVPQAGRALPLHSNEAWWDLLGGDMATAAHTHRVQMSRRGSVDDTDRAIESLLDEWLSAEQSAKPGDRAAKIRDSQLGPGLPPPTRQQTRPHTNCSLQHSKKRASSATPKSGSVAQ